MDPTSQPGDETDQGELDRSLEEQAGAPGLGATRAADELDEVPEPQEPG